MSCSAELLSSQPAPSMMPTVWLDHRLSSPRDYLSNSILSMEINSTSPTGPTVLQSHLGQQSPLLPWLPSPGLPLSDLGDCSFCSHCGGLIHHYVPPAIHSSMPLLGSKPFTQGVQSLGTRFPRENLPLALVPQLKSCSPDVHQSPQPGVQEEPSQSCDIIGIRAEVRKDSSHGSFGGWRYNIFSRD